MRVELVKESRVVTRRQFLKSAAVAAWGLRRMNAVLKLTWTIELEPAEHKQLGYIYEVYVRR